MRARKFPDLNLLGVKYILTIDSITNPQYKLVLEEGRTKTYQNLDVLPKAFFASEVSMLNSKQEIFDTLYSEKFDHSKTVIISGSKIPNTPVAVGKAKVTSYKPNEVLLDVDVEATSTGKGYLVLTDVNYPSWHAQLDGQETDIFTADYIFRGVVVPPGRHKIRFFVKLF